MSLINNMLLYYFIMKLLNFDHNKYNNNYYHYYIYNTCIIIYFSVRNKALPVVRDDQNLWPTINSYHEVVRSDNHLCEGYFHITLLLKFISHVTVRVENFDYSGELLLVG